MEQVYQTIAAPFKALDQMIIDQLHSDVGLVENIGHYIVEGGGKRLRPVLVLLTAQACGYPGSRHIELATIIEFIHTATLLHDDVVDHSNLRRGRATANAKWGNAPSVLVGDFLYSRAFQMMVKLNNLAIMDVLSNATNTIAEGEVLQLINAGDPAVDEARYLQVIHHKTATLFEAASRCAAILSDQDANTVEKLGQYGTHLGLAFQLIDDALDYAGDSEQLGKNVGDDLAEGKPTLPLIYTMQNGTAAQAELVERAIRDANPDLLNDVVEAVTQCGAIDYTKQRAREEAAKAQQLLTELPESDSKQALIRLCEIAAERDH